MCFGRSACACCRPAPKPMSSSRASCFNDYVLGSRTQILLRKGDKTFVSELGSGTSTPAAGTQVRLGFNISDAIVVTE